MMYGDNNRHQQQQHFQYHAPPHLQHQHQQQHSAGDFQRGPPPGQPHLVRQPSASSTNLSSEYHHFAPHQYDAHADSFGGKRMRTLTQRRAVDYTSTFVSYMQVRMWQRDSRDRTVLQSTPAASIDMLPAVAYSDNPSTSFAANFVHTSLNKNRCSTNRVVWTPTGRRLITGSQSGEFTLWNGQSFNFELIIQAHDQAIRSMVWSHNDNWMVSGDDGGSIKYWQNNMNNVKANKSAHKESVRDISFCRTDLKFCSCSDDTTVKVWDFARCQEERSLSGHGWDVKSVDWHPTKSLLVSGGKDNLVKLWDAKAGIELCSFHGHKNTVLCVKWNQNGNWVLTASKDQIIKIYDIRAMKELQSFRGHSKDVTALAWHPFHEEYFVSGSYDGSMFHWLVGHDTPQLEVYNAHDNSVWDLAWHPIGYLLCSGSNDHTTKFWCRNRPGGNRHDMYNMVAQGYGEPNHPLAGRVAGNFPMSETPTTPGPFPPGSTINEWTIPGVGVAMPLSIPSLDSSQGEQPGPGSVPVNAPPFPTGPHPSLLPPNQHQPFQMNPQRISQQHQPHQSLPQQMGHMQMSPNMSHLLPHPPHALFPHSHLPRPQHQMPLIGPVPSSVSMPVPPSASTSLPMQMQGPLGMQGGMNQMHPPLQQGHYMGLNPMHPGTLANNGGPPSLGGFANGLPNMQGPSNPSGPKMYPQAGSFNHPQAGQMPVMPGYKPYPSSGQSGMTQQPGPRSQTPQ